MKSILIIHLLLITPALLFAEAIFKKDGSIVSGKILKETNKSILLQTDKEKIEISRSDITRILLTEDYKEKVYFYKMNGDFETGYLVDELPDSYIYRKNLSSPKENSIKKNNVNFISKKEIKLKKSAETQKGLKRFDNLFGIRLGGSLNITEAKTVFQDKNPFIELSLFSFEFYYTDKYFDAELIGNIPVLSKHNGTEFYINFYPLNFTNVNLGLGAGLSVIGIENQSQIFPSIGYKSFLFAFGLSIKLFDMIKASAYYYLPLKEVNTDVNISSSQEFKYTDPALFRTNLYLSMEVYVWDNISVKLGYKLFIFSGNNSGYSILPGYLSISNHQLLLSIGYGFNIR